MYDIDQLGGPGDDEEVRAPPTGVTEFFAALGRLVAACLFAVIGGTFIIIAYWILRWVWDLFL